MMQSWGNRSDRRAFFESMAYSRKRRSTSTISTNCIRNYTRFYRLAEHFRPDARAALAIGGGGYTFPRDYLRRNADVAIDVVEIDPELTELSRQYFALRDHPRMKIYHEDGRMFVARTKKKYDVVFLDAFNSAATIPFHLTTVEFTRELGGPARAGRRSYYQCRIFG